MTIGIYKINFHNTEKVYIGQSKNIENRVQRHLISSKRKECALKLQTAFDTFGFKNYEIILECDIDELDSAESQAVEIYDSLYNGFNSLPGGTSPSFSGEINPSATNTNEQYKLVLKLLVQDSPSLNKRQIADITGVSLYTIRHIAALESHGWLEKDMPVEYAKLKSIKKNNPYYYGTDYPALKAPDGTIHKVTHITNFAKQYGLLQPKVSEVMRGTRKSHKGWTRVE